MENAEEARRALAGPAGGKHGLRKSGLGAFCRSCFARF